MFTLNRALDILVHATTYRNLTVAASHVGLSQPQLSRLVKGLEDDLGVTLLDRGSKRQSTWTRDAHRLAQSYRDLAAQWTATTDAVTQGQKRPMLRIAALEGLMDLALLMAHELHAAVEPQVLSLDPFEVGELEENLAHQRFDLALTCREPGKAHFRHSRIIGWQTFHREEKPRADGTAGPPVMSPFEFYQKKDAWRGTRAVISHSLATRRAWVRSFGGTCDVPSPIRRRKGGSRDVPVILLGAEDLPDALWKRILAITAGCLERLGA